MINSQNLLKKLLKYNLERLSIMFKSKKSYKIQQKFHHQKKRRNPNKRYKN